MDLLTTPAGDLEDKEPGIRVWGKALPAEGQPAQRLLEGKILEFSRKQG